MANDLITITAGDYTSVALPVPSTYKVLSSTIVDSGRNGEGKVVGGIIRNSVRSIEISWNFLTRQQFSDLARLFDTDLYNSKRGNFFFSCTFFDPTANAYITRNMYVSDRPTDTAQIKMEYDGNGKPIPVGYVGTSISLVEV